VNPGSIIAGGFWLAVLGLITYGLSYELRRFLDERAWRRVERRIARNLGVAPPPASARHSDSLRKLREHQEAVEGAQFASALAEYEQWVANLPETYE
jgi:hypothetical protein